MSRGPALFDARKLRFLQGIGRVTIERLEKQKTMVKLLEAYH